MRKKEGSPREILSPEKLESIKKSAGKDIASIRKSGKERAKSAKKEGAPRFGSSLLENPGIRLIVACVGL